MKILVVGGGGKKHAICYKLAQSPSDDIRHGQAAASTELVGRRDLGPTTRTGVGRHLLRLCLDLSDLDTNLTELDITLRDTVIEGLPPGAQLRVILGELIEACAKLDDETLTTPLDLVQLGVKPWRRGLYWGTGAGMLKLFLIYFAEQVP